MGNVSLFIEPEEIKATTYVDENVDEKILRNTIKECMDIYLHPLLGTGLYNDLKTQINTDPTLASYPDYKTLLDDYLQSALKYFVLYEGIDVFVFKFTNKTVGKKTSENTVVVSLEEIKRLQDKFLDKAQWYAERAIRYLKENASSTKFKLYLEPGTTSDTLHPMNTSYSCGWYLGEQKGKINRATDSNPDFS